ncbi:hypothetical protein [Arthrobacter sp. NicSoilB8]|uniref:hypothetical protein n=1 Tax=Arthrobacter sp. NicSoilB8 TaxID=2830998 RepID=UPI001CC6278A|nr:hypothetical protein [Arthrobacter sp. NicSoilB8]BCW71866.1 hypothetical protein NicSoilB8_29100 [Arthrobacter sp. NicSoilB8]
MFIGAEMKRRRLVTDPATGGEGPIDNREPDYGHRLNVDLIGALVQGRPSCKSAPMIESDAEVARTLSTIPVRASRQMTGTEYQVRVAEVLNLFDIEAVGDETGIRYGGEGVELEDQPLEAAVRILIGRRFGIPEARI